MKFFIYSRKSVYTGKGESIENQIEMCKKYISAKFSNVNNNDIIVYEDEGFSAKNTDRPQFQQMLYDIKLKKPDFIICYRLDRISRNVSDFSSFIENLNNQNISFVCIKEEFDTSKPMGKAMMYIASVFAQLERETIAERIRDNMLMLARTGRWLGGTTPTGFTSEKIQEIIIDDKIKTSCKLKESPDELKIVYIIFEKFLELESISGVSKYLIKQEIKSRNKKYYSLLGIKNILQNPVYCTADKDAFDYFIKNKADVCFEEKNCNEKFGLIAYNKRNYQKKHAPRQPIDKWIIAIGKHKGLISGKKWTTVQYIIKNNIPTGREPAKIHNNYSLLSGFIYCEKCGCRMFAKRRTGKNSNSNLYDYICSSKMHIGIKLCNCQNLNGQQTDKIVCEHIKNYLNESPNIYQFLKKSKHNLQKQMKETPFFTIESKIKKYNNEINNLISILSQNKYQPAFIQHINTHVIELNKEISNLTKEKIYLEQSDNLITENELKVNIIADRLSHLKNNFNNLTIYEKRTLIKLLIKKIIWDGKNLHVFINDE